MKAIYIACITEDGEVEKSEEVSCRDEDLEYLSRRGVDWQQEDLGSDIVHKLEGVLGIKSE